MSKQYPGGVISKTPVTPTSLSAPGIWTLNQQAAAQATNTWPFPRDPQFNYVTMLLHADGAAGAVSGAGAGASSTVTNFNADASTNAFNVTINGDARSDNFSPYLGTGYYSVLMSSGGGAGSYFSCSATTPFSFSTGDFCIESWVYVTQAQNAGVWYPIFDTRPQNATNGAYPILGFQEDTKYLFAGPASGPTYSTTTLTPDTWMHVVWTRVSSVTRCFINGVLVLYNGSDSTTYTVGGNGIRMGSEAYNSSPNATFPGFFSNYRVSKGGIPTAYSTSSTTVGTTIFTPPTAPASTSDALSAGSYSLLTFQSNRFIDNSSNASTITGVSSPAVSPAVPFTVPSSVATYGSGYFDGTGDSLSAAYNSAFILTADFSIEMFVYPVAHGSYGGLMSFATPTNPWTGWYLIFYSTTNQVLVGLNNTDVYTSTASLTLSAWNHVALCRTGSTVALFINGVRDGTVTNSGSFDSGGSPLYVGVERQLNAYTTGYFSSVRIVKGSNPYGTGTTITVPTSPLTAVSGTSLLTTQYNGGGNNSGFKDGSQNNFPVTRYDNTTQGTFTPYGSNWSNYINGSVSGAYLQAASSSATAFGTGNFTIEMWVNSGAQSNTRLAGNGNGGSWSSGKWVMSTATPGNPNKFIFACNNYNSGADMLVSTTVANDNAWHHIAVVRNSNTWTLYVDGTSQSTVTSSVSLDNGTSNPIGIGYSMISGDTGYTGYISNFRMTNTAVYTANFTPSTTNLTAISGTQLLTCQSNRLVDNSTNALAITPALATTNPFVQRFSPFAPLTVYNPATNGGSAYFDGSGDYLTVAQNNIFNIGTGAFTVEAWVYLNGIYSSGGTAVINLGNGANGGGPYTGWGLVIDYDAGSSTAYPAWYRYDGSTVTQYTSSVSLRIGQWAHLAVARNSSYNIAIWVNGTRTYSGSSTVSFNAINSDPINIGKRTNGSANTPNWMNGYIGDGRVVVGANVYDPTSSTLTVPTSPLTAVAGTQLLLNTTNVTNSGIFDNAMMNEMQTVGNAMVSTSVKKYGAASMYFDGSGDYLLLPNTPVLDQVGDYTYECWYYRAGSGSGGLDILCLKNVTNMLYLYVDQSNFKVGINQHNVGSFLLGTTVTSASTWYHLAMCRSGSTVRLFVNGVQEASGTYSTDVTGTATTTIGGFTSGGYSMNGYIDDLRVTKAARYTTTFTVPSQAFPNG